MSSTEILEITSLNVSDMGLSLGGKIAVKEAGCRSSRE